MRVDHRGHDYPCAAHFRLDGFEYFYPVAYVEDGIPKDK